MTRELLWIEVPGYDLHELDVRPTDFVQPLASARTFGVVLFEIKRQITIIDALVVASAAGQYIPSGLPELFAVRRQYPDVIASLPNRGGVIVALGAAGAGGSVAALMQNANGEVVIAVSLFNGVLNIGDYLLMTELRSTLDPR